MKPTGINTNDLVRRIRDAQYEQIKDKSPEELIRYFRERAAMSMKQLEQRAEQRSESDTKSQ